MTRTHKIELESFVVILAAAALGVGVGAAVLQRPFLPSQANVSLPVMEVQDKGDGSSMLVPSPTVSIPEPKVTSQISPDGTKLLTMTQTVGRDGSKKYEVVASDSDGSNQKTIYTGSGSAKGDMSIPFNTWSPDDRYVFVNRTDDTGVSAIVMRADGEALTSESQTFDAKALFDSRETGNTYQEATGWASETLVVINSVKQDGGNRLSYWLEVPSAAIIPLSTQF